MQNQKSPFDISSSSPGRKTMQGRHAKTDSSSSSGLLLLCWIARGASSFRRGWVLKNIYGSFLLPHTVFPKNTLGGVYLFTVRKANRGCEKYRKIIFVKECF